MRAGPVFLDSGIADRDLASTAPAYCPSRPEARRGEPMMRLGVTTRRAAHRRAVRVDDVRSVIAGTKSIQTARSRPD